MSWTSKITNDFRITTGDGQSYVVNWKNAGYKLSFNTTEFNFIGVNGTLVSRETVAGRKFDIEVYFQGDDNLDTAEAFRKSCQDARNWRVSHPFYGNLIVTPFDLEFDNRNYNVTTITGSLMETIDQSILVTSVDPVDKINFDKGVLDDTCAASFATNVPVLSVKNKQLLSSNLSLIYKITAKSIALTSDAQAYFNGYSAALSSIESLTASPLLVIRTIQAMINEPSLFIDSVKNRINMLVSSFNQIRNFSGLDVVGKRAYETNGSSIISTIAQTSVTNPDYQTRNDVLNVMTAIATIFTTYKQDLDNLQSSTGGKETSYVPDAESMYELANLINFTISNLTAIAIASKQERTIYCEQDTNLILLAHRFYGPSADDSNIIQLQQTNNIGMSELLIIPKDRKIVYYI